MSLRSAVVAISLFFIGCSTSQPPKTAELAVFTPHLNNQIQTIPRDVFAYNHSNNARARWVTFGWDTKTANEPGDIPEGSHVIKTLPDHRVILAAPVKVPGAYAGPVTIDSEFDLNKSYFSPSVQFSLPYFRPIAKINGITHKFTPHSDKIAHEHYRCAEWRIDLPPTNERREGWHVRLWTELGRNDDVMPFWVSFFAQNKVGNPHQLASLEIGLEKSLDVGIDMHVWHPTGNKKISVSDGGAATYRGAFLFFSKSRTDLNRIATLQAEKEWPLDVVASWWQWGIWRRTIQPWTDGECEAERAYKYSRNIADPMQNLFGILNNDPGNTGEQSDFGAWHHLDLVSNPLGCMVASADQIAAARALCRPIHFFEENGNPFVAVNHPKCVMWSERPDDRVSEDILGREDQEFLGWSGDLWRGDDREHASSMFASETAMLWYSPHILTHLHAKAQAFVSGFTLPSTHGPDFVRNGTGNSRSFGRSALAMVHIYYATGWKWVLEHARNVCEEVEFKTWFGHTSNGPIWARFVTVGNPKVSIDDKGAPTWVTWQEGLYVAGMNALAIAFRDVGWNDSADKADEIARLVGRSLVLHGFFPDDQSPVPQVSLYQRWRGSNVVLKGNEWRDPALSLGSIPGTAFTRWAELGLRIVARYGDDPNAHPDDKKAADRARVLIGRMGRAAPYLRRYSGTGDI